MFVAKKIRAVTGAMDNLRPLYLELVESGMHDEAEAVKRCQLELNGVLGRIVRMQVGEVTS